MTATAKRAEVIVIGGGQAGMTVGYYLGRAGNGGEHGRQLIPQPGKPRHLGIYLSQPGAHQVRRRIT